MVLPSAKRRCALRASRKPFRPAIADRGRSGKEAVVSASLPPSPSLEQLRKQAKDLVRLHRSGDQAVVARVAAGHPGAREPLKLSAAQLVIARELGFPSWPALRAYVDRVVEHGPGLQHAYHEDLDYYEGRAFGLLASAASGPPGLSGGLIGVGLVIGATRGAT